MLILDAPIIEVPGNVHLDSEALVTVKKDGCN